MVRCVSQRSGSNDAQNIEFARVMKTGTTIAMHTYEVFLKPDGKEGFSHAGSLDAPDDEMAALYARETYCRRGEGTLAWIVDRRHVVAIEPSDLEVTARRQHSMNDGSVVAARRKSRRAS